jgi:hypothetical protein
MSDGTSGLTCAVASVLVDQPGIEQANANARLIAAAPEMAEALIGLCKIADEYSAEHGDATIPPEVTQARALLARIRGNAQ